MQALVDSFWPALSVQGVSWIGFYFGPGERLDDGRVVGPEEMLLGPCRDKPACSPIGLHGVCGQGWRGRRAIVVKDVRVLGAEYVACDPRDQSEVVVPLIDGAGRCFGVLDADSFHMEAFSEHDVRRLTTIMTDSGLIGAGVQ
jgi:putative methionine-R-sulfoxide reductase with GAF domain